MNHSHDEHLGKLVRNALAPVGEQELQRDLWPRIFLKLQEPGIQVPWIDWVLVAVVVILCLLVPGAVQGLFYNL